MYRQTFQKNNYRSRNEFEKFSRSDSNNFILRFKLYDINMIRDNFSLTKCMIKLELLLVQNLQYNLCFHFQAEKNAMF